jgi:hypothetical protein
MGQKKDTRMRNPANRRGLPNIAERWFDPFAARFSTTSLPIFGTLHRFA